MSEQVTDRLFVQQLLTDPSILNQEDRKLLLIRFNRPEATFRELASSIGYSKDKVSRVIARCDAKVRLECPDLFHYVSYYSTGKKNRSSRFSSFKTDTVTSKISEESGVVETPSIEPESSIENKSEKTCTPLSITQRLGMLCWLQHGHCQSKFRIAQKLLDLFRCHQLANKKANRLFTSVDLL